MNFILRFDEFLNEDTPNQGEETIDTKWGKMEPEEKIELLLQYVKDPDEAEKMAELTWEELPEPIVANLVREPK
jgi:hypothetical protein